MDREIHIKRTQELLKRLDDIAAELRDITNETGTNIQIITEQSDSYEHPCSIVWFGTTSWLSGEMIRPGYKMEHLFGGKNRILFKGVYEIRPEEVRWNKTPEGLEYLNNKKKRRRK